MNTVMVQYVPIGTLLPCAGNARQHSQVQIGQIAKSINAFGFINPVVIDAGNQIIAGHGRLLAAKKLGLENVPVIRVEHLDETQRRAYMLADNKIGDNATWDKDLLRVELELLTAADPAFDLESIGFATPEVNLLFQAVHAAEPPLLEPASATGGAVSAPGDLWRLDGHRILCGDCRDATSISRLFGEEMAQMIITDPPYNVPITGHVSGLGKIQHDEFAMASGELSDAEFFDFLVQSLTAMTSRCADGSLAYAFMDWRHIDQLVGAGRSIGLRLLNICVWVKNNAGMGSLYRSQHELVAVFKKGSAPHINNIELGKHGRYRTNVWHYAGMNALGSGREEALAFHPTVKPVAMIRDAIADATHINASVFDGFLGSGSTLLAAEQTRRRCFGLEISPAFVDVAIRRWMDLTGNTPVLDGSGKSFHEVQHERRGGGAE